MVPTYPSGMIGFSFCSKKYHPINDLKEEKAKALARKLRYYNLDIHRGAFALPQFIRTKLEGILY